MADIDFTPEEQAQPQINFTPEAQQESTLHKLLFGREAAEGLREGIQSLVPQSVGAAAKMAFYTPVEEAPHAIKEAVDVLRGVPTARAVPESQTLVGFIEKPLREQVKIGTELAGQVGTGVLALSQILHPILGRGEISPVAATESEVIKSATQERQIQKGIQPERIGTAQGENVPAYAPQVREAGGEQAGRGDSLRTAAPQEVAPVPQPEQPEKITSATITVGGKTSTGIDHATAVENYAKQHGIKPDQLWSGEVPIEHSGFLTSTGRIVDLEEANRIAKTSGSHAAEIIKPVSEAGQPPVVSGQPKIISTAVQTPEGIKRGTKWNQPHDEIAQGIMPTAETPTTKGEVTPRGQATVEPSEEIPPSLGEPHEKITKRGGVGTEMADRAGRVAVLLNLNSKLPKGFGYDPEALGRVANNRIDAVRDYLIREYNRVTRKPSVETARPSPTQETGIRPVQERFDQYVREYRPEPGENPENSHYYAKLDAFRRIAADHGFDWNSIKDTAWDIARWGGTKSSYEDLLKSPMAQESELPAKPKPAYDYYDYNPEPSKPTTEDISKSAKSMFNAQFKAKYPDKRLNSKFANERWNEVKDKAHEYATENLNRAYENDVAKFNARETARNEENTKRFSEWNDRVAGIENANAFKRVLKGEGEAQPVSGAGKTPVATPQGIPEEQKGFIIREPDGTERFTNDRTEAAGIAKAAGQVKPENAGTTELHSQQLSEQPQWQEGAEPAAAIPGEPLAWIGDDKQPKAWVTQDDATGKFVVHRDDGSVVFNPKSKDQFFNNTREGMAEWTKQEQPVSTGGEAPTVSTLPEQKETAAAVSGTEMPPAAASTVDHPAVADFKETTTSSPQSLGILPRPSEFVRQDVARVVTGISKGIRQIRAALTPANVSPIAGQTARIVREHAGQLARDREIATVALQDAAQILRRNSKAENLSIIDRLEKGQSLGNKGLDDYRTIRQSAYDQRIKQVQEVNPKAMQDLIENYFPHLWTRESIERLAGNLDKVPADNPWARVFGKRPLTGPATFLKQRTIPTTAEGIALGLEPVTTNPIALDLLKMHEMDRYVMGHKIMQEMKDNGLAKFVPAGERPDFGHVKINDRIARVYGPRGWKIVDEQGRQMPGQKVLGDYYAPEDAARIINNYLSPGLRGNAVYDSFRLLGNTMNQVQLGISAYHAFFTAIDSATSTIALGLEQIARSGGSLSEIAKGTGQIAKGFVETPVGSMIENLWRGNKFLREYSKPGTTNAELAKIVDTATAGGSRVRMDTFYNTGAVEKFFDALKSGNYTGALLRAPLALVQTVAKPLMEYTVPRLKLGIISQQLEYELSKLPKNATQDQIRIVAGRVVDSVDNRMGQLIYDNLFWNKALKDGLMASVRSVGWNLGDIRELGGGALDSITAPKRAYTALTKGTEIADNPVFTKRMAYTFALPLYVGVLGSIYQYLMTGKGPQSIQDAFMPRTGRLKADGTEERVMLPTYMKDVYPLALAAGREGVTGLVSRSYRMAVNKLHPALSSIGQMIHNQDYYGNQILSPDDPLIQQHPTMGKIYREAEFIAKQFQPFSFRGVAQREGGLKEKAQAVAGIMPATRELTDTPAMRMIHDINLTKRPAGGYTKVQQQKRADRRAAQTGQDLRPELFKRLSNEEKARVLEVATPEERAVFQSGSSGRSRIRRTR